MRSSWSGPFIAVNAMVGLAFGASLLLAPDFALSLFGLQTDATGVSLARLFGAELAGFNLVTWLARDAAPPLRPVVLGHVLNETLTAIVLGQLALAGSGNLLVAGVAIVAAAFAAGYGKLALSTWDSAGT